jgi:hypothetical protein
MTKLVREHDKTIHQKERGRMKVLSDVLTGADFGLWGAICNKEECKKLEGISEAFRLDNLNVPSRCRTLSAMCNKM